MTSPSPGAPLAEPTAAAVQTIAKTATVAEPSAAPTPAIRPTAPPGYKFVKVQKADGSVVTVRRKLTPEEAADRPAAPAPSTTDDSPKKAEAPPQSNATFKVVLVQKPDGTLVKVRRPIQPSASTSATVKPAPTKSSGGAATRTEPTPKEVSKKLESVHKEDSKKAFTQTPKNANADLKKTSGDAATKAESAIKKDAKKAQSLPKEDSKKAATEMAKSPAKDPVPIAASQSKSPEPVDLQKALEDQTAYTRERRRHRFNQSIKKGLARIVGSAIPAFEISDDFLDGDEIMSEDDYSDDSYDDDNDNAGQDDSHGSEYTVHDELDEMGNNSNHDDHNVTFDAGAAAGGLAAAIGNSSASPRPPPPTHNTQNPNNGDGQTAEARKEKEKVTYKVTNKELNDMDEKATEKLEQKALNRHWVNFSFYLMASLSVLLPASFLVLAAFIIAMDGKPVNSNWGKMTEAIKVAVSAWPIVFAAVVAQCFKSWATWKVERGIKLMELEQLVGSNSFGSAVKQPFLLRRLDVLTLVLFGVWCLSPIGSQALQRVQTPVQHVQNTTATVHYVSYTGKNKMYSPGSLDHLGNDKWVELSQFVAIYYQSSFMPLGLEEYQPQDKYAHPFLQPLGDSSYLPAAAFGVPIVLPDPRIKFESTQTVTDPPWEEVDFNITTSYYSFKCGNWSAKTKTELDATGHVFSSSQTLALRFTSSTNGENMDSLSFASANRVPTPEQPQNGSTAAGPTFTSESDSWTYSSTTCEFTQVFVEAPVQCLRNSGQRGLSLECWSPQSFELSAEQMELINKTVLEDITSYILGGGSPSMGISWTTPTEWVADGQPFVPSESDRTPTIVLNITSMDLFEQSIGYLINTWVMLGWCPDCIDITDEGTLDERKLGGAYTNVNATLRWTDELRFQTHAEWVGIFFVCAVLLVVAGASSIVVESMTVAPDVLGYASSVARNSRYLHLPKLSSAMSGGERANRLRSVNVMMQDVNHDAKVGKIALGLKSDGAHKLEPGRVYR